MRFADVDRAGILYYPRFLNYFHIAFEEFFGRSIGVPYADLIERDRLAFPMVHLEVDFKVPLAFGDHALVLVRPTRVGRTSVDFTYEVTSRKKGVLCSSAKATTVAVNIDTFAPLPVPEPYRGLLLARVGGGAVTPPRPPSEHLS